jgi:hypothetical protein
LSKRATLLLAVGFISAEIAYGWGINDTDGYVNYLSALMAASYFSFGVIGILIRVFKRETKVWTYLRQASY